MLKETGVDWLLAELIKKAHVRQNIVFIECYKKKYWFLGDLVKTQRQIGSPCRQSSVSLYAFSVSLPRGWIQEI
jgi:hypothetical protein